jgi:fumarate reductase subunit D
MSANGVQGVGGKATKLTAMASAVIARRSRVTDMIHPLFHSLNPIHRTCSILRIHIYGRAPDRKFRGVLVPQENRIPGGSELSIWTLPTLP